MKRNRGGMETMKEWGVGIGGVVGWGGLDLGGGWDSGGGLVSGSGESVCPGNISGEGFQGFKFGEEVMDVEVGVVYFVV